MDRDHISFLYVCKVPPILSRRQKITLVVSENFKMILRQKIGTTFLMDKDPLSFPYVCKVPTAHYYEI